MEYRKIIHIDMDAFYASVEQRDNPELRGKPIAVGHAEERGVVATASYEARKYGVHSAMSSVRAKKLCPQLIFIHGRMDVYMDISRHIRDIFHRYTDIIEPLSLDEAFLDVTQNKKNIPLAVTIAKEIKQSIWEELHLHASAGVSYNKFLAKIASDFRKPDGLCTIHPSQALDFISKLRVEQFWGVGPKTAERMHALGLHTGKDLQDCTLDLLIRQFGKAGYAYFDFAHGKDDRPVETTRIRKSIGTERTLEKDIVQTSSVIIELYHVASELEERLLRHPDFKGNTLTLKIKFYNFDQITRSITQDEELTSMQSILPLAKKLLKEVDYDRKPIRLIGLSVSNPKEEHPTTNDHQHWEQLSFDFKDWDY
ncbi:MAG: DNA polymerase IV [Phocaeicola sp.]|nr:DNA polymerase IV [Phocaeicola sp.]